MRLQRRGDIRWTRHNKARVRCTPKMHVPEIAKATRQRKGNNAPCRILFSTHGGARPMPSWRVSSVEETARSSRLANIHSYILSSSAAGSGSSAFSTQRLIVSQSHSCDWPPGPPAISIWGSLGAIAPASRLFPPIFARLRLLPLGAMNADGLRGVCWPAPSWKSCSGLAESIG